MRPFDYYSPYSLTDACNLLAGFGADARILAGGTDVLVELRRSGTTSPKAIVDISRILSLKGIKESGHSIIIRPLTTHAEVLRSEVIGTHTPLFASPYQQSAPLRFATVGLWVAIS